MSLKLHTLIVNFGSPRSTSEADVSAFIRSLLMDQHVLRMPSLLRYLLVNCVIIPRRRSRVASLYQKIWPSGAESPIVENSRKLTSRIEEKLREKDSQSTISFAMCHGGYSLKDEVKRLNDQGVTHLLVIPLYPQYEESTYQSAVEHVKRVCSKYPHIHRLFTPPFYDHGDYISALERSVRERLQGVMVDRIVFSYHSIPTKYDTDRYRAQCELSTRLVCERIGVEDGEYSVVYQSGMTPKGWLTPTLSSTLRSLPSEGVESVAVIAPSFPIDCFETLYEIDIEGRDTFMSNGGKEFHYIPALNDLDLWAKKLAKWIIEAEESL